MDRFIDLDMQQYSYTAMHLKSNMDRFIEANTRRLKGIFAI